MQLFVGVTDLQWYEQLKAQHPTVSEVNFWRPSGQSFGAVPPGSPLGIGNISPFEYEGRFYEHYDTLSNDENGRRAYCRMIQRFC